MGKGDDIAKRISNRLKWLEKNDNPTMPGNHDGSLKRFWNAGAYRAGRYVKVWYVSYQGGRNLTFDEAERYAQYLEDGNNGRHYEALRTASPPTLQGGE